MRVAYVPPTPEDWAEIFSQQTGAGFVGMPYQRGAGLGSIFRGIFRALLPIVKHAGKAIGKQALSTGAEIVSDVAAGNSIKEAVKRRTKAGTAKLLNRAATKLQSGGRKRKEDQLGFYY